MIKQREANSWKTVSYAKSISGAQTYTKFPIVLRTTEQSIPTWSVKGNMAQNGTPTPTTPITPQECGERTENWFNKNATNTANGYVSNVWLRSDGTEKSESGFNISEYISCNASTQYTLKYREEEYTFNSPSLCFYDASYNFIDGINYGQVNPITITTPSNAAYMRISYRTVDASDVMLNTGSTAKPYEPYGYKLPIVSGGVTTNIYLSEPLRKIGDYADTIAADGTVTRRIKKLVLTGQEVDWRITGTGRIALVVSGLPLNEIVCVCSHYKGVFKMSYGDLNNGECTMERSRSEWAVYDSDYNTVDSFKAFLAQQYSAGTPVTVWYVLSTPTTESTTTSAIPTALGLNTIDVATSLKPSEMSLTYDGYKLCKGQRYMLLMHDNPLCGISTYKDTLNLATGACTRQVKKLVLTGEENWVDGNFPLTNTYLYYLTLTDMINVGNVAALDIVCSHFQVGNYYAGQDAPGIQHTLIELYFRTTETTLASFKQWLADQYVNGTPVTLYYILATPTTETITVPTGLSGTEEGYLTQSETPTPTNPVYPTTNVVSVWE